MATQEPEQYDTVSFETNMAAFSDYASWGIDLAAFGTHEKQTLVKQDAFLASYVELGSIYRAAPAVGITRQAVQYWNAHDLCGFKARFEFALFAFRESLQDIAIQRIRNPKGNRGSDVLVLGLLNAHWPEKYRQNVVIVDETPRQVLDKLSERRKARVIEGRAKSLELEEGKASE